MKDVVVSAPFTEYVDGKRVPRLVNDEFTVTNDRAEQLHADGLVRVKPDAKAEPKAKATEQNPDTAE